MTQIDTSDLAGNSNLSVLHLGMVSGITSSGLTKYAGPDWA